MDHDHILVVDDSEITGFKIKAILIRLGYAVTTFSNAPKAMEWLQTPGNLPSLILSDVNMPEMNGFDFVRALRKLPGLATVPVIMLTSQTEMEDKIAGLQAGADDYLGKTVTPTELELRVKALLARKQTSETTFSQSVARTISVFSLRGGVGATSVSANLSIALTQLWGIEVCLWDMAVSSGHCAALLNLKPKNSLASLNDGQDTPIEENTIRQLMMKHASGITVMPAPLSAAEAELITPKLVEQAWPYIQGGSSYLVVDAGSHFTEPVLDILARSDVILLMLAPDILSVKSAGDALDIFNKMGFDLQKVLLVINHIFPTSRLSAKKIIPVLRNRPAVEIPYDSERFVEAILSGEPLITAAPKCDASLAIFALAYMISAPQMESQKKTMSRPLLDSIRKLIKEI